MINVAIIGTGAISSSHIEAYLRFPDRCKIVALVDIYPEKAQAQAQKYGIDAEIAADYHEVIRNKDIQLVSVCTPPYTHAPITIDCLQAGHHVLVEKPMSSSLHECDAMIAASQSSKRVLSVVAQNRFRTPMMKLKSVLDSGIIGKIVHAQVDSFWWRGYCYYDLWWRGTWEKEGGGCTLNHAVHHIDALQWMMGLPEEITAVMSNTAHDNAEVEDLSVAILRYTGGSLAQVTSSVVHHGEEQQLVFQGTRARVSVPWKVYASKSKENGFPERDTDLERQIQEMYDRLPDLVYEGHTGEIDNVLTAIETGAPVLIDGDAGRRTLELITAIYKSASTGARVPLPLSPGDPFYTQAGIQANAIHFYEKKNTVTSFKNNEITTGGNYR